MPGDAPLLPPLNELDSDLANDKLFRFANNLLCWETMSIYDKDSNDEFDAEVVVDFDRDSLLQKIVPTSDAYDEDLANFDLLGKYVLKTGTYWKDRTLVHSFVKCLSSNQGWTPMLERKMIQCNRAGKTRIRRHQSNSINRVFKHGKLKLNCDWAVKLKPAYTTTVPRKNSNKTDTKPDWDRPVMIESAFTSHTNGCTPGLENRIISAQRGKLYTNNIPISVVYSMCHHAEQGLPLTSASIKTFLSPHWPTQKEITRSDVFNVKRKITSLSQVYLSCNNDYAVFKNKVGNTDILQGIDNQESLTDDQAYKMAQSAWVEVSRTCKNTEDAIFSFLQYLELIKTRARGFSFEVAKDYSVPNETINGSGTSKELLGVVWMTGTMRRNLELFGSYMCFDMMMRGINTLLFPYAAITLMDEFGELCLGCEGMVCGETYEMYSFIVQFVARECPGMPLSKVKIVSADGFFSQDYLTLRS